MLFKKIPLGHGGTQFLTGQEWWKFMEIRTIIILEIPVLLVSRTLQNRQFRCICAYNYVFIGFYSEEMF